VPRVGAQNRLHQAYSLTTPRHFSRKQIDLPGDRRRKLSARLILARPILPPAARSEPRARMVALAGPSVQSVEELSEHRSPAVSVGRLQQLKARKQIFRVIRRATGTFQLQDDIAVFANLLLHACNLCFYFCQPLLKGGAIHETLHSTNRPAGTASARQLPYCFPSSIIAKYRYSLQLARLGSCPPA
jgi:hypothetical protein